VETFIKKRLYPPLLLTLLASLIFGALPLGQPAPVYAAPDTVTIRPGAAGDETGLTIGGTTPAATNWESVDDPTADDDATLVYAQNIDTYLTDLYNLADTALSGTINSVTVYMRVKALVTPDRASAYTRIKTNGVAYDGTAETVTTSWADYSKQYTTNPQTASAWTWTEVNALQAGAGLRQPKATGPNKKTDCTQVWVVVDYTPAVPPNISNLPTSYGFGTLAEGGTYETTGGLTEAYFTVTNNSAFAVNITISGTDMTGGTAWTLSNDGTAGSDIYGLNAGLQGGSYNVIVNTAGGNTLKSGLGAGLLQKWGLQLLAPTSFSDSALKSGTVTLTATQV